jgi:hypothetical protein
VGSCQHLGVLRGMWSCTLGKLSQHSCFPQLEASAKPESNLMAMKKKPWGRPARPLIVSCSYGCSKTLCEQSHLKLQRQPKNEFKGLLAHFHASAHIFSFVQFNSCRCLTCPVRCCTHHAVVLVRYDAMRCSVYLRACKPCIRACRSVQ